jgi:hypothetical protein
MDRPRVSESAPGRWTHAGDYVEAMARKRTARHKRERRLRRTQPESPRLWLSTVPYLALIAALAVLTIAIAIAAFPGTQPLPRQPQSASAHETGVAQKGWMQEAEREFHH